MADKIKSVQDIIAEKLDENSDGFAEELKNRDLKSLIGSSSSDELLNDELIHEVTKIYPNIPTIHKEIGIDERDKRELFTKRNKVFYKSEFPHIIIPSIIEINKVTPL